MIEAANFRGPRVMDLVPVNAIQRTILNISKEIEKTRMDVLNQVGNLSPMDIWVDHKDMFPKVITLLRAHLGKIIHLIRLSVRDEKDIEKEIGKKLTDAERNLLKKIARDERRLIKDALAYFNYWAATSARGEPIVGTRTLWLVNSIEREFYTKKIKDVLDNFLYDDETLENEADSFLHSLVRSR